MNKQKERRIRFDHLADLSTKPEDFRCVYQLQLDSNPNPTIVEGPLFLKTSENRPGLVDNKVIDVLFANQLQTGSLKDAYL